MKRIVLLVFILFLIPATMFASEIILKEDTKLQPQGWVAGSLEFKKGSKVELNEKGEVIAGELKWCYYLRPAGYGFYEKPILINSAYFGFDNTMVTFNEHGRVVSGTPVDNVYLYLIPYTEPFIKFRGNSPISFDNTGNLVSGTLADDTFLRTAGSGKLLSDIKFKAGTEVVFGPKAQVLKGTIVDDLKVNGVTFPAGTRLQFSESAYPKKI